jgi:hypothetical protein
VQRAVAEGEVGEREEAVEQQQRAERPGEERGQRRAERAQVEALEPLRAEAVLAARGLAVVREEAAADLLGDDAPEAEVGVLAGGGGRRGWTVAVVDGGLGHGRMIHGPHAAERTLPP